jgi:amino acid transporter
MIDDKDFLLAFFVFGFLFVSIWLIGRLIEDAPRDTNRTWIGWHFQSKDVLQLGIYIILAAVIGIFMLYVFNYVSEVQASLGTVTTSDEFRENLPYMSLALSFLALGITTIIFTFNGIKEVVIAVTNRVRYNELNRKLETIQNLITQRRQ